MPLRRTRSGWVLCRTSMVSPSRTETTVAVWVSHSLLNDRGARFGIETDAVSPRSVSHFIVETVRAPSRCRSSRAPLVIDSRVFLRPVTDAGVSLRPRGRSRRGEELTQESLNTTISRASGVAHAFREECSASDKMSATTFLRKFNSFGERTGQYVL